MLDMTPVCENCGKIAPVDKKSSTPQWTVYDIYGGCECGGKFKPKCIVEAKRNGVRLD